MGPTQWRLVLAIAVAAFPLGMASGADRAPRPLTDLIDRFDKNAPVPSEEAGVGLALARRDGRLVVFRILPGTPAAVSGKVHVGDRLIAVGQGNQPAVDVKGMSIAKAVPLIRGTKGTLVVLTIIPTGKTEADAVAVPLTRGVIKELNLFGDGRVLPPGTKAPNFEAIVLPGGGKYELKSSLGKVVVVEFWASWCAPCHELLDHLQDLRKQHPEWKDRVEFVAIAIDEDKETALRCFQARGKGWSDLTVVWAGPQIPKPFHIASFPGMYLLNRQQTVLATDPKADLAVTINKALAAGPNGN
jgi:thiol-disulfide isomerase/thioredoxin